MTLRGIVSGWISFQKNQSLLFAFGLVAFLAFGLWMVTKSEIEAFPEFTNTQVQIITQFPGKASEEVERQVTIPLEIATNGLPGLINQRSTSIFGLSVITLTFDDNVIGRQARLDVSQRLNDADLPDGVKPTLSPDSTPVGEIFRYTLSGSTSVDELRLTQDWTLERAFKSIPGVADVVSFGGPIRTLEIKLDVPRMKSLNLSATNVAQALGQNHANAGGAFLSHGEEGYIVRSLGMYEKPENLEAAVVMTQKGVPIHVRDIGHVGFGHRPRLGIVGRNEADDVVEGIILLRQGADSLQTCQQIRALIEKLNNEVLPATVRIEPYYDRTDLISRSSHTVFHNVVVGVLLVSLFLLFGLGLPYWPIVLSVATIIPFSLLMVFIVLRLFGLPPNLISLGAVDFGIIIETAIFAAEAVILALAQKELRDPENEGRTFSDVMGPALLCALILLIAFIPILSLQRVEGRIFRPLGVTLLAALLGGQIGTFIFIPLGARWCPPGRLELSRMDRIFDRILEMCRRLVAKISLIPQLGIKVGLSLIILIFISTWGLGREFLPQLNEGSLYIRATAPSTISIEAATDLASKIRRRLMEIPDVVDVVSQTGRPDDGTDVNGFDNSEILVTMKPPDEWKTASTIEGLTAVAQSKLSDIDGVDFNFSQPIKDNVDEAISGVKGELVVKVFGPKIETLQSLGDQIGKILRTVPGVDDVGVESLLGQPEMRFQMNREVLAHYGLRVADTEDVIETSVMGKLAGKMIDELGRAIPIIVKPNLPEEPSADLLSTLPVFSAEGLKIPLSEVSSHELSEGVGHIYRETGERRIAVKCSVRNRSVVEFVRDANLRLKENLKLPEHYRLAWSGSFENAQRAGNQLLIVVPLCLLAIIVLLMSWFKDWKMVGTLLWEIPFAALGGLIALRLFGLNFSISAAAGGIVLIGVTALTGMMYLSEWRIHRQTGKAILEKGRSIIISNAVAIIGLIPASFSHGIGSETAKPFAVMILGGLITSLVLSLTLLPALAEQLKFNVLESDPSSKRQLQSSEDTFSKPV